MTTYLAIRPRDPVVARDGRPFGINSGRRMRSLAWPYPSVAAGSLRTAVGKLLGGHFESLSSTLRAIEVAGPLPESGGRLFLPAPDDLLRIQDGPRAGEGATTWRVHALRPRDPTGRDGIDLPPGLRPVCSPDDAGIDEKPGDVPAWWSAEAMADWLASPTPPAGLLDRPGAFRDAPARDERTHVAIAPATFAALDGLLFSSAGLILDRLTYLGEDYEASLSLRVRSGDPAAAEEIAQLDALHPIGGERRLARFEALETGAPGWEYPEAVRAALGDDGVAGPGRVRMLLVSPAIFAGGLRPGWIDPDTLCGRPPGCDGPSLRLVGLVNRRWRAVSGWSYEAGSRGPKPTRRLVPAGAVYFFEVVDGPTSALADRWLEPAGEKRGDEGFGLAAWGVW